MQSTRLNSRLEWQGAEFLVLAHMLIARIEAYKPYVNHPGYDLVAVDARTRRLATISVKSRWATNRAGFFQLNSLECDFVVHVALNRGERSRRQTIKPAPATAPQIYVFPIAFCKTHLTPSGKISVDLAAHLEFENAWDQVIEFLARS